jgi:ketosteroid isomerase-like protein
VTVDQRKELARQVFDAFARGDLAVLRDLLPPTATVHQCGFLKPISGEAILQGGLVPGGRIRHREVRLVHVVGEGDIVALHWRTSGRYSDPESPGRDGRHVDFPSMTFVRFEAGAIAEIWNIQDRSTLESQLREAEPP